VANLPGAFTKNEPYGMPQRVSRALGVTPPPKQTISPMQGTVGPGKGTSTITGQLAPGMGKAGQDPMGAGKQKNLFGGVPPLNPKTRIPQQPKETMSIRYASAPSVEDALKALDGDDLVDPVSRLVTKEAGVARILETINLLDVLNGHAELAEKTAALMRLAEVKKESEIASMLRVRG
jgi:hypothetical protein